MTKDYQDVYSFSKLVKFDLSKKISVEFIE